MNVTAAAAATTTSSWLELDGTPKGHGERILIQFFIQFLLLIVINFPIRTTGCFFLVF